MGGSGDRRSSRAGITCVTGPACKLGTTRWVPGYTGGACARCLGGAQASLSPWGGPVVHVIGLGELAFEVSTPALPVRARTIDGAGIGNVYLFRSNKVTDPIEPGPKPCGLHSGYRAASARISPPLPGTDKER